MFFHMKPTARDKLMDAAVAMIREKGFCATSVDDLCKQAGVTKGAFFHHFDSKEKLGVEAARHWDEMTRSTGCLATSISARRS